MTDHEQRTQIEIVFEAPRDVLVMNAQLLDEVRDMLKERGVSISFENQDSVEKTQSGETFLSTLVATPTFEVVKEVTAVCIVLLEGKILGSHMWEAYEKFVADLQSREKSEKIERFKIRLGKDAVPEKETKDA